MKTILRVNDEVCCNFIDLPLDFRKSLHKKYKIQVPNARFLPSVKLGRWDGCTPFFSLPGATYVNLLPEIIDYLDNCGVEIELEDRRTNTMNFTFAPVDENSFNHRCWGKGHALAGQPIILRDYQVTAINTFLENPQGVGCLPTGSGKTLVSAALSQRVEQYGRSILIVPSKTLVEQTEEDYLNLGLDVGVYFGERKEFNRKHTICTWQSLGILLKNTKNGLADITIHEFLDGVVCVIGDECHIVGADILKSLLTGVMANIPVRWGMTGTIPKEDFQRMSLIVSLGNVIQTLTARALQDAGVLSNCDVHVKQFQDYKEYKTYPDELKYLSENNDRLETVANMIEQISQSGNTLVLVPRIATGKHLASMIPNSVFVQGATKTVDRKIEFDEIKISTNKVIVATYGVASVGINLPRIFNLVMFEPGKSFVKTLQSIGRGLRKAHDKDHVDIYDVCSSCKFSKRHLGRRKAFYAEAGYPFKIEKIEWL